MTHLVDRLRMDSLYEPDEADVLCREAADEIERLEAENFKLAAWQCEFTDGKTGLVAGEGGSTYCAMAREVEAVRAANRDVMLHWEVLKADYDKLMSEVAQNRIDLEEYRLDLEASLRIDKQKDAEIERLRAALHDSKETSLQLLGQVGQLSEENTRLRAALEKIGEIGRIAGQVPGPRNKLMEICDIARAALEGK